VTLVGSGYLEEDTLDDRELPALPGTVVQADVLNVSSLPPDNLVVLFTAHAAYARSVPFSAAALL
jgi:hypothetical protein